MPPAAKISVVHACAKHPPNAQVTGSSNTLVGFLPAGRVGDATACGAAIAAGAATVLINHRPAARLGDSTTHGGKLVTGHPNVLIGDTPQSFSLGAAAATGKPFCEECEKARRRLEESDREQREELEGDAEKLLAPKGGLGLARGAGHRACIGSPWPSLRALPRASHPRTPTRIHRRAQSRVPGWTNAFNALYIFLYVARAGRR